MKERKNVIKKKKGKPGIYGNRKFTAL